MDGDGALTANGIDLGSCPKTELLTESKSQGRVSLAIQELCEVCKTIDHAALWRAVHHEHEVLTVSTLLFSFPVPWPTSPDTCRLCRLYASAPMALEAAEPKRLDLLDSFGLSFHLNIRADLDRGVSLVLSESKKDVDVPDPMIGPLLDMDWLAHQLSFSEEVSAVPPSIDTSEMTLVDCETLEITAIAAGS
jgi:hypothetical protein